MQDAVGVQVLEAVQQVAEHAPRDRLVQVCLVRRQIVRLHHLASEEKLHHEKDAIAHRVINDLEEVDAVRVAHVLHHGNLIEHGFRDRGALLRLRLANLLRLA